MQHGGKVERVKCAVQLQTGSKPVDMSALFHVRRRVCVPVSVLLGVLKSTADTNPSRLSHWRRNRHLLCQMATDIPLQGLIQSTVKAGWDETEVLMTMALAKDQGANVHQPACRTELLSQDNARRVQLNASHRKKLDNRLP